MKYKLIKLFCFIFVWLYIGTWLFGAIFVRGYVPLIPAWGWNVNATNHYGNPVSSKLYRFVFYDGAPSFLRVGDAWFSIENIGNDNMHIRNTDKPNIFPYLSIIDEMYKIHEDYYESWSTGKKIDRSSEKKWVISRVGDSVVLSNAILSVSVSVSKRKWPWNTHQEREVETP